VIRSQSLFGDGSGKSSIGREADGLLAALEYVESPLDQMKRAGLGLISKGLGRWLKLLAALMLFIYTTLTTWNCSVCLEAP
jgi:hypothetical protein